MNSLKEQLIREIQQDSCDSQVFELLAYFIEKGAGQKNQDVWPEDIINTEITENDVDDVSEAIVRFLDGNASAQLKSSAIWALGKTKNVVFKPVYIGFIRNFSSIDNTLLYQALVAVGEIDRLTDENVSMSLFDAEGNKALAKKYLSKIEV